MDQLIRTESSVFIYGDFKGEKNQQLFQCSRQTEDTDVPHYINEHRALVSPMGSDLPFENDKTEDLRNVKGKTMVGYYRMYYRYGWDGRWMFEGEDRPDLKDASGVQKIIDWFCDNFPKGCSAKMIGFFLNNFEIWGSENRYLIKPYKSEYYKVMVDTTYGNGDYPVRIYCYRDKGKEI